jgi:hypothetical protein
MPQHGWWQAGSWNFACDQCGLVFKSSEGILRWDGAYVDAACWEPRHPQDFVKAIKDDQTTPWARPWGAGSGGDAGLAGGSALGEVTIGEDPPLGGP